MLAVDQPTDVAERELAGFLASHQLTETAQQEVVRQLLHPADGQLSSLPAQRAGKLAVIRILSQDEEGERNEEKEEREIGKGKKKWCDWRI